MGEKIYFLSCKTFQCTNKPFFKKNISSKINFCLWRGPGRVFSRIRMKIRTRSGSRIFSRGGGGFSKNFPKFWRPFFFRSTKLTFRALPKHCLAPILAKLFAPQANFSKKQSKTPFLGTFWKILTKKNRVFFGARSPSKLVGIGAKGAFRKILGSVGQKWISEKVSKGGPFGSAGGRIPERGGVRPPPRPP